MTQVQMLKEVTNLTDHITALAGDAANFMARLVCEDTHPHHEEAVAAFQALPADELDKYRDKKGNPNFYLYVRRQAYHTFMHDLGDSMQETVLNYGTTLVEGSKSAEK